MKLSLTAEYALRAMVWLSGRENMASTVCIAEGAGIPASYLSKVMQALVRQGLVISRRGRYGGFMLALPPDSITAFSVIAAVDPTGVLTHCPLGYKSDNEDFCPLHHSLIEAVTLSEKALRATCLSDLLRSSCKQTGRNNQTR